MSPSVARKRIYVAYVGGTIGMKATDNGYAPVPGHLTAQVRDRPELHAAEVPELSIAEYSPLLDSANAGPADWLRIARDLSTHRAHYDGFVVLHGTDTMAYTASALAFLLRGLGKPVVVTGSQIPLGVLRSDGRQNLLTSVLVAARDDVREVCLVFGSKILRGCRSIKASASGFEAFRLVVLPLIRPGLVAGALFAFITSLDNVPVTIFLISGGQTTLPVLIFSSVEMGVDPSVAAVSTLLIVATLLILLAAERRIGFHRFI